MNQTNITPDTTLYTGHADACGYTAIEGILGNQSAGEYRRLVTTDAEAIASMCEWISGMIGNGFWLTREECEEAIAENRAPRLTVYEFTPAGMHAEIMRLGAEEEAE